MATAALKVLISGDAKGASRALKSVREDAKKTGGTFKSLAKIGGAGVLAIGAAGVAIAGASVKAAIEDQKSQKLLANSLKNTTHATKAQIAAAEEWITKTQNASGIMDDDLRPALSTALRATGNLTKAQGLLKTAMDVSTATGKPLATVTLALSKGYMGNTGALGKLGIKTKDASGHALKFADIMKQLKEKMGGATAAAADTLSGKMAIAKAKFEDVKEQIGQKLIPVLASLATFMVDKVIPAIEATVRWIQTNWPKVQHVIVSTVRVISNIVRTVLDGIRHFWRVWGGRISAFTRGMFNGIRQYIGGVMKVIRGIIKTVTALIHGDWKGVWTGIKQIFSGVWNSIKGIVKTATTIIKTTLSLAWLAVRHAVKYAWDRVIQFFGKIPSRIGNAISTVAEVVTAPFRSAFAAIAHLWNSTVGKIHFKIPGWVPGIGGKGFSMPTIGNYDKGGIVPGAVGKPQMSIVHGGETIFTPAQMRALGQGGGGGGGRTIINLPAGIDPAAVVRAQRRHERRNGHAA